MREALQTVFPQTGQKNRLCMQKMSAGMEQAAYGCLVFIISKFPKNYKDGYLYAAAEEKNQKRNIYSQNIILCEIMVVKKLNVSMWQLVTN